MSLVPPMYKLDKSKAEFVDVLHTDAGIMGTTQLSGNVDFFANGGRSSDQPACTTFIETISLFSLAILILTVYLLTNV